MKTASARRILQILWLLAALLFTLAILHVSTAGQSAGSWATDHVPGFASISSSMRVRLAMEAHMAFAEKSWAKTVRQRHEMIRSDYQAISEMPLYVTACF